MALRECPNCRASVDDVNPFCSECGTRLNAAPTAAEGPTQALPRYDGQAGSYPPPPQNYDQPGSYPPPPQQNYGQAGSYPPPPQQNYGQPSQPGSYPPPPQQNYGGYQQPQNYGQAGSYPPPSQQPQQPYGSQQQYTPANYQQPNYGAAYPNAGAPTKRSNNTGIVIGIIVGIVILIGAGIAFVMNGKDDDPKKLIATNSTSVATATTRPTRTPASTDEPEPPTSEPSTGGAAFLEDDFSNTDEAWPEQETASKSGKYAYVEGAYQIHVYVNERIIWTSTNEVYGDVDAEIDVKMVSGKPENAAGLVLREQIEGDTSGSLYVYQIDGQGNIAFRRYDKVTEEWTNLVDWKYSSAANEAAGATNRLRVVAVGSNFTFYLNGEKVANYTDDTYPRGAMGFGASTFEEGDTLTEFDNLRMAYP